ncbi:MAG: sigma-70 family RNA polymerase sigma factor [Actinomycetota bacterium]|nr:sigma-70 family RNA polymerase sigma factor [Actinomycetota bacterium]
MQTQMTYPALREYTAFARRHEPALRHSLVAHLGYEAGREATQDALVFARENWNRLQSTHNPGGYLFRVAKRRALRRARTRTEIPFERSADELPWVEPKLEEALRQLSRRQRAVVFLVEGLGLSHREAAEQLNISKSAVQTHLESHVKALRRRWHERHQ